MPFPVDEKYIRQTENTLGVKFPASYRMKMLSENGGEISTANDDWQLFPFLDSSDSKRISRTCNDLIREGKKALELNDFPPNGTAIGSNGSGDYLVFVQKIIDQLSEEVFIWRHETGVLEKLHAGFLPLLLTKSCPLAKTLETMD